MNNNYYKDNNKDFFDNFNCIDPNINNYNNYHTKNINNDNLPSPYQNNSNNNNIHNINSQTNTNNLDKNLKYQSNIYNYDNFISNEININESSKTQKFLKKLLILSNIESNFIKIFSIDKLLIPLLLFIKYILLTKIPSLNKYIFKEKKSSLKITYTHYTSTYYNQQNNSSEYLIYKSILSYVYDKKPFGCKFTSNSGGNIIFFEDNEEIQINKKIWIVTTNTPSNTSCIYMLELISYTSSIDEINKFIKYCIDTYKKQIQSESLISSGLKYYKYLGMHNSTHQCMFDEYPFTQTKTFSNIFFVDKESLVHKIKYFCSNEETYKLIGRPYSMGIMLYGKPGTGKTSCIKAIAALTQRHIVDVSLKKIKTQKELNEIFYGNKVNGVEICMKKRLYVLEEFDCIIDRLKDRKLINIDKKIITNYNNEEEEDNNKNILGSSYHNQNYNHNQNHNHNQNYNHNNNHNQNQNHNQQLKDIDMEGVNLENLLCLLDGTVELCGSMFVATTNYIDLIDRALIRPGRFDCCVEFDNATDEIIIQIIKHFSKKNLKKIKKNRLLTETKFDSVSASVSSSSTTKSKSPSNKLTSLHIEEIKKYSLYEDKLVWSPAKISQICLFYIDSPKYYDNVVLEIKKNYESECKLLKT
jgi:hypothetical protein